MEKAPPMNTFRLISDFTPKGDQPLAIQALSQGVARGEKHQVLLGVTGSGKTYTMAQVIADTGRPSLVIAPNKTLAAQLYSEFRGFFPENAVEYFVSYYDYYQPEAYLPSSDTYIQKDSHINDMIDKLRHSATRSVLSRRDVVVVASVSCIFGLGAPEDYLSMRIDLAADREMSREKLLADLVNMHYERSDMDFHRGTFRVRGDRVEVFPSYEEERAIRIDFFGDEIERIFEIDALRGEALKDCPAVTIFPASHYVTGKTTLRRAMETIKEELKHRVEHFRGDRKYLEAQRIEERTNYDLEMIMELGYCSGIENYSRHITGRRPGESPPTLLEYFPEDFLVFIDESHITVPQLNAMYRGDRSRKQTLVDFGFRLPSALDNRPLTFEEFMARVNQVIYTSATPSDFEMEKCGHRPVEQIVRPTGLIDPRIDVRKAGRQVDDLLDEIRRTVSQNERVLVTTLTKRMAEDLTEYYSELGVRVRYLHADITTLERMDILRDLRRGEFDVLVGINLLREGLDIPEVSLVAILDADKEGFLRSTRSLIQTFGRAARNVHGRVLLYADRVTPSMQRAMDETRRRRRKQRDFNATHHIVPQTVIKEVADIFQSLSAHNHSPKKQEPVPMAVFTHPDRLAAQIDRLRKKMNAAARDLEFEKAADFRDQIRALQKIAVFEM
jgi:excinuclease ABC subunit B